MNLQDLIKKELTKFSDEQDGFRKFPRARFAFTRERAEEFSRVSIETILDDKYFLGLRWNGNQGLYPALRDLLLELEEARNKRIINTFIFTGAVGGGKTTLISIITYIEIFKLLVIPDPSAYYSLTPNSDICFIILSRDETKAKKVSFKKILPLFSNSPVIQDYFPAHIALEKISDNPRTFPSELRFPKNIILFPGNGSAASALGYNIYGGCFTGDTKIKIVGGETRSLKELENTKNISIRGFDVDKKEFVNTTAERAEKTKENEDIYELELENGSIIKCTKDHLFLTYRKNRTTNKESVYIFEYKKAEELTIDDDIVTEDDFIRCNICNKLLTQITPSHCKLHGVSFKDYIKDLPKEEYVSAYIRKRIGRIFKENFPRGHMLGRKHTEEEKRKIGESNKGKVFSEETRKKMSISGKKRFAETPEEARKGLRAAIQWVKDNGNYWKGKKMPEEAVEKVRKANKGKKHPQVSERLKKKGKWKGKDNPRYGQPPLHGKREEYKGIKFRSSWEVITAKTLDENGIEWIYEPEIFQVHEDYTYTPDFFLPFYNLYLEVKGYFRNEIMLNKFLLFAENNPIILIERKEIRNTKLIIEAINENKIYKVFR